jgi:lipopolysaccharide export system permease protein
MNYITRIIIKEWFKALIGSCVVLFLMYSIADVINGFLQGYDSKRVVVEYVTKIPFVFGKLLPLACLLSTLFSINKLKSHAELMAILASGYSIIRIYIVILISSLSLLIFQFLNLGFLEPELNRFKRQEIEKSRKSESKYLARSSIGRTGRLWYKTPDYFVSFIAFDKKKLKLNKPTIYYISDKHIKRVISADSAIYLGPKKWLFKNAKEVKSLDDNKYPLINSVSDLEIAVDEIPEDLNQFESDITTLNIIELNDFIARLKEAEISYTEYEIMFFEKISLSIACITFALFPIFSLFTPSRRSSSFGKEVIYCLVFTIGFWTLYSGSLSLGSAEKLPIYLAALIIPTLGVMIISTLFLKHRKL